MPISRLCAVRTTMRSFVAHPAVYPFCLVGVLSLACMSVAIYRINLPSFDQAVAALNNIGETSPLKQAIAAYRDSKVVRVNHIKDIYD
jgi:hypothetical protein